MGKITFSNDLGGITQEDIQEAVRLGESYFHTEEDPTQLRNNETNFSWINNHFPKCLNIIKYKEKVMGFTLILPCNKECMNDFLSKKINERELFDKIKKRVDYNNFETIYLCEAYVGPDFRRKGLALNSFVDSVNRLNELKNSDVVLFHWAYSQEGGKLAKKVGDELNLKVLGV